MLTLANQVLQTRINLLAAALRRSSPSGILRNAPPERLLLAPQDLLSVDHISGEDISAGRFYLAGILVDCGSGSPFSMENVPLDWEKELHSFQWLRHLANNSQHPKNVDSLTMITDWLSSHGSKAKGIAWQPDVAAKRLITWICHSVPVVEKASPDFYRNWLKSIGYHIRYLRHRSHEAADGMPRMVVRIALCYAAICVSDQKAYLRRAPELLDQELIKQIGPDGCHISRNPANIVEILTLLLPLRQSYARLGVAPSQIFVETIDRLMGALKFFKMGDGNIARFNGSSTTRRDLISTILYYDDALAGAPENATWSGYQRLEMGKTILIADTGKPPIPRYSSLAHAGTLSFEFTSGVNPVVVNCAAAPLQSVKFRQLARSTAAHSTLSLDNHSSSRIYSGKRYTDLIGPRILSGPSSVPVHRKDTANAKEIEASHNGYKKHYGLIHSRKIVLKHDGLVIEGLDRLTTPSGKPLKKNRSIPFDIRFHLHPGISAGKSSDGRSIILMVGNGVTWKFTCIDIPPAIDESIYFASAAGPRKTRQLVLSGIATAETEVRWIFIRQLHDQ